MLHTRLSCQLLGGANIIEVVQSICLDYMTVFCWRLDRIGFDPGAGTVSRSTLQRLMLPNKPLLRRSSEV